MDLRQNTSPGTRPEPQHADGHRLESATVRVRDLSTHPRNPRRGDVEAIKGSLRRNGQYRPLVVNRRTMEVLAGNHTLLAARALGWEHLAVTFVDADDEQARRILLVDNRTSDLADYDLEELLGLLTSLDDLEGTAYDPAALDALLDEVAPPPLEEDVPSAPAEPRARPGDVFGLGPHRLLCGDARDPAAYEALLRGERPELLWSDPPYGANYHGRTRARLSIEGDEPRGLEALLRGSFACIDAVLYPGSPLYLCHPAGPQVFDYLGAFAAQGWALRQGLVWVKDSMVLGRSDYQFRHEPLLYGFKPGEGRLGRGGAGWYGGNSETSVLEVPRPRASREHPTMKPPELVEICLRNSTRRGALVLDPFAGSGSTLVACERLGRSGRLIELDPRYCDVIVERYERLTGQRAERL